MFFYILIICTWQRRHYWLKVRTLPWLQLGRGTIFPWRTLTRGLKGEGGISRTGWGTRTPSSTWQPGRPCTTQILIPCNYMELKNRSAWTAFCFLIRKRYKGSSSWRTKGVVKRNSNKNWFFNLSWYCPTLQNPVLELNRESYLS